MVHKINEYEVEEDGVIYVVEEYSNGGTVKYVKPSGEPLPPDPMADAISEGEQAQLEMQTNIEYLTELAEMNREV